MNLAEQAAGAVIGTLARWSDSFMMWGHTDAAVPFPVALLIVALGCAVMWWQAHWATIPHELGHAFMALVLGKKLSGISLNRDTSGETETSEAVSRNPLIAPFRWLRGILVSFSGYPAPLLYATLMLFFWGREQSRLSVLLTVALLAFTFLYITNLFGFLLVLGGLIVTGGVLWADTSWGLETLTLFLGGGMLAGGIKGVLEAWNVWKQDSDPENTAEPQHSDARALSRKTLIPQVVWLCVFSGVALILTGVFARGLLSPVLQ